MPHSRKKDEDDSSDSDVEEPKAKRKRQPSAKAKEAAVIAESDNENDKPKKKKQKQKQKKNLNRKKTAVLNPDNDSTIEEDNTPVINWEKYPDLTWKMINTILDDTEMRKALYPPATKSGESTRKNGGRPKTDYMWTLAVILFTDHEEYKHSFCQATTPVLKSKWVEKIRNRIKVLGKATSKYKELMGSTGEGIKSAEDIDMSQENKLTSAWSRVEKEFPWYFQMRELEAERPNKVPAGLGNSRTDIDIDLLTANGVSSDGDGLDARSDTVEWDLDAMEKDLKEAMVSGGESSGEETKPAISNTTVSHSKKPTKKTAAKASLSSPAIKASTTDVSDNKKSRNASDRFSEMAIKEEETAQRVLDLEKTKALASARQRENRDRVKGNFKIKALELKSQERLARMRLEMEHKLKVREMELKYGLGNQNSAHGPADHQPQSFPNSRWPSDANMTWPPSHWSTSTSSPSSTSQLLDDVNEAASNFGLPLVPSQL